MNTTINDTLEAALPGFPGFYNSELSALIDREIENEAEWRGKTVSEIEESFIYGKAMLAVAQAWADEFKREFEVDFTYECIESPKEYNFVTDRIFVEVPLQEAARITAALKDEAGNWKHSFEVVLRKMFTSYDGFCSFYPNNPHEGEWLLPLEEWDHNQLQALLAAYVLEQDHTATPWRTVTLDLDACYEAASEGWS